MENQGSENASNNGVSNNQNDSPLSILFEQAENLVPTLSTSELQQLRDHIQAETDHRHQEMSHRHEEEEQRRREEKEKYDRKFAAWKPKFLAYDQRKGEEWMKKHSDCKGYGSATKEDSEESEEGMEYDIEEVNTSDLDSDAAADKARMDEYNDRKLKGIFEFELLNPKIYARTMREGESSSDSEETLEDETDGDRDGSDADDVESTPSSVDTSPAPSESADEWFREEEDWNSDDDDY
ncbi:transcription initiation factor TFIID subunit 11-like [Papaver somniferum]|uniref:transcription initiation factor TFIID subunit 11-like n=1 Tax=Papaver somniferum TaxID=3469 RepID=UPI000E6FCB94|nr:transcription initiation factor TFIID subunit 11-like [Papaver somniferum]